MTRRPVAAAAPHEPTVGPIVSPVDGRIIEVRQIGSGTESQSVLSLSSISTEQIMSGKRPSTVRTSLASVSFSGMPQATCSSTSSRPRSNNSSHLAVADVGNNSLDQLTSVPGTSSRDELRRGTVHHDRSTCHHSKAGEPPLSASAIFSQPRSREVPEGCDNGVTSNSTHFQQRVAWEAEELFGTGIHVDEAAQSRRQTGRRLREHVSNKVRSRC